MGVEREVGDRKKAAVVSLGVTPGGKEIQYVARNNATVRFIEFGSGGQVPECLQGGFNSVGAAQAAANSYLSQLKQGDLKEDTKAKAQSKK